MSEKRSLFYISPNCNPDEIKKVKSARIIFYVALLIVLPVMAIMIVGLWYGTDTTIIFRNDEKVLGYRIGHVLSKDEYPQIPIAVEFNGTDIFYAHASNISYSRITTIGFIIINQEFMQVLMNNHTLMVMLQLGTQMAYGTLLVPTGEASLFSEALEILPITPYLRNHTVTYIVGNIGYEGNKDVKFKIASGSSIIPVFSLAVQVNGLTSGSFETYDYQVKTYTWFGIWNHSYYIDYFDESIATRGSWEISLDSIDFNPEFELGIQTLNIPLLMNQNSTTVTFNGELKRSYNLVDIFTPVSQYATVKMGY